MDVKNFTREDALRVIAAKNAQKKVSEKLEKPLQIKKHVMLRPSPLKTEVKEEEDDDNW